MKPVRRKLIAGLAALVVSPLAARADPAARARELAFHHVHTGEKIRLAYFDGGRYQPEALAALDHLLRDWRTGDVYSMDPGVYDQLYALQAAVEAPGAFDIICGYRSPATNQSLAEKSDGVAKHSLHMEGKALDVCLPGKDLAHMHAAALSLRAGGVGYYPSSGFIHMDTGRVRHWG